MFTATAQESQTLKITLPWCFHHTCAHIQHVYLPDCQFACAYRLSDLVTPPSSSWTSAAACKSRTFFRSSSDLSCRNTRTKASPEMNQQNKAVTNLHAPPAERSPWVSSVSHLRATSKAIPLMLTLPGHPHLRLNRAKAWVTADRSGWIAKALRKILDYGGMFSLRMIHLSVGYLERKKKAFAGFSLCLHWWFFHIYNLLQCSGTFLEDPFWDVGICGNGLLSTSVRSDEGGKKACAPPPPSPDNNILPSRAVILGKVQSCKQPTRMLRWSISLFCRPIPENLTKKTRQEKNEIFCFFS